MVRPIKLRWIFPTFLVLVAACVPSLKHQVDLTTPTPSKELSSVGIPSAPSTPRHPFPIGRNCSEIVSGVQLCQATDYRLVIADLSRPQLKIRVATAREWTDPEIPQSQKILEMAKSIENLVPSKDTERRGREEDELSGSRPPGSITYGTVKFLSPSEISNGKCTVVAGINGGYFGPAQHNSEGWIVADGRVRRDIRSKVKSNPNYIPQHWPSFVVYPDGRTQIGRYLWQTGSAPWAAVTAGPVFIEAGAILTMTDGALCREQFLPTRFCTQASRQSAIALDRDGRTLYLLATSEEKELSEIAEIFGPEGLGVWTAMRLDGGSSTQLVYRENDSLQLFPPKGNSVRAVSDALFLCAADRESVERTTFNNNDNWIAYVRPQDSSIDNLNDPETGPPAHFRGDIWMTNVDGSQRRQLTSDGNNLRPAWSPDGRYILFEHTVDGVSEIYLLDMLNNGYRVRIASQACCPVWSPTDNGIYYISQATPAGALTWTTVDGTQRRVLLENFLDIGLSASPIWRMFISNDGRRIFIPLEVISRDVFPYYAIWEYDIRSGDFDQLEIDGLAAEFTPRGCLYGPLFSPTNSAMVFTDDSMHCGMLAPGSYTLWFLREGKTRHFEGLAHPSWSPAGQIAVEYYEARGPLLELQGIALFDPATARVRLIIQNGQQPAWRP